MDIISKIIIDDLNKVEKLNDKNYDVWRCRIWYILEEKNTLEGIHHLLKKSEEGNIA